MENPSFLHRSGLRSQDYGNDFLGAVADLGSCGDFGVS